MCSTRILRAAWAAAGDEQEAPPSLAWHKGYVNHPNYITPGPRKTAIEAIEEANGCTEFYTSRGGKYITMQPERALAWANIVYCHLGKAERYTQVSAPDPNRACNGARIKWRAACRRRAAVGTTHPTPHAVTCVSSRRRHSPLQPKLGTRPRKSGGGDGGRPRTTKASTSPTRRATGSSTRTASASSRGTLNLDARRHTSTCSASTSHSRRCWPSGTRFARASSNGTSLA